MAILLNLVKSIGHGYQTKLSMHAAGFGMGFSFHNNLFLITMPCTHGAVFGCTSGVYHIVRWKSDICDVHVRHFRLGRCFCEPPFALFPFTTVTVRN